MSQLQLTADILLNEGQLDARLQAVADEARARLANAGKMNLTVENIDQVKTDLGAVEKMMTTVKTIAGASLLGGAAIGIHSVYETAQELDNAQTILTKITGSASEAQKQVAALNNLAIQTPLSLKDVLTANQYLVLAQHSLQELGSSQSLSAVSIIRSLGDVAYSLGKGANGINDSARALLEVAESGSIMGNTMRMLRADIPNYKAIIAKYLFGSEKDADQVTTDVLHSKAAVEALFQALNDGAVGPASGVMDAANKSLKGAVQRTEETIQSNLGRALNESSPAIIRFLDNVNHGFADISKVVGPLAHIIGSLPQPIIDVGQALLALKVGGAIFGSLRNSTMQYMEIYQRGGIEAVKSGVRDLTTGTAMAGASMRSQVAQARQVIGEDSAAVQAAIHKQILAQEESVRAASRAAQAAADELAAANALKGSYRAQAENIYALQDAYAELTATEARYAEVQGIIAEKQAAFEANGTARTGIRALQAEYTALGETIQTTSARLQAQLAEVGVSSRQELGQAVQILDGEYIAGLRLAAVEARTTSHQVAATAQDNILALEAQARKAAAVFAELRGQVNKASISSTLSQAAATKALYTGPVTESGPAVTTSGQGAASAASSAQAAANSEVASSAQAAAAATQAQSAANETAAATGAAAAGAARAQAVADEAVVGAADAAAAATVRQAAANKEASASGGLLASRMTSMSKGNLAALGGFMALTAASSLMSEHVHSSSTAVNSLNGALSGAATGAGLGMFIGPEGAAIGAGIGAVFGGLTTWAAKSKEKTDAANKSLQDLYNTVAHGAPSSPVQNKAADTAVSKNLSKSDLSSLGVGTADIEKYAKAVAAAGGKMQDLKDKNYGVWEAIVRESGNAVNGQDRLYNKLIGVVHNLAGAYGKAQTAAEKLAEKQKADGSAAAARLTARIQNQKDALDLMTTSASDAKSILSGLKDHTLNSAQAAAQASSNILDLAHTYQGLSADEQQNGQVQVAIARAIYQVGITAGMTKGEIVTMASSLLQIPRSTYIGFLTNAPTIAAQIAALQAEVASLSSNSAADSSNGMVRNSQAMVNASKQLAALQAQQNAALKNFTVSSSSGIASFADPASLGGGSSGGSGGSGDKATKAAKSHKEKLAAAKRVIASANAAFAKTISADWEQTMKDAFAGDTQSVQQDYSSMIQDISGKISDLKSRESNASAKAKRAYEAEIKSLKAQEAQVRATATEMQNYSNAIAATNAKIQEAQGYLDALTQAEADQKQATLDQITSMASLDGLTSAQQMLKVLTKSTEVVSKFQSNLAILQNDVSKGLISQQEWDQLAALGPGSSALIDSLAHAPDDMLKQIDSQSGALTNVGNTLADYVSQGMYGQGVSAAQGYLNGFAATLKTYQKQLNDAGVGDIAKIVKIINRNYKTSKDYTSDIPSTDTSSTVTLSAAQLQDLSASVAKGFKKALNEAQRNGLVLL